MTKITYLINIIAGPGAGKTTIAALLFANLKLRGYVTEYVQEFAKNLVWLRDFNKLNNQYYVSCKQYMLLKQIDGQVDFIITDGTILHGLYYNRHNRDNTSNIEKTEEFILNCHNEFKNINIFLDRHGFKYETQDRLQTEEEAKEIDIIIKHMLKQNNIPYVTFTSSPTCIDEMIEYIIKQLD